MDNLSQQNDGSSSVEDPSHSCVASSVGTSENVIVEAEIPDLMIWVKEEPFFGILSPHACCKIGVNVLRKVAEYCRDKEEYYPEINLIQWGHISKYKLQLPIDLSWAFLRVFDIISRPLEYRKQQQQKQNNSEKTNSIIDSWDARCEEIRMSATDNLEEIKVDTLKFLIFLFIQHTQRLHKKFFTRSPTSDDLWPVANTPFLKDINFRKSTTSPNPNSPGTSLPQGLVKKKSVPEQIQAEFLIGNLRDIIDYLCNVIKKNSFQEGRIPIEIVKALTFVLGAASISPHDREFKSLDECLVVLPEVAKTVDYDSQTGTVDKTKFVMWVKTNLKLNPWGPSSTPIPQHRVECVTGVWEKTRAYEANRIFWNTQPYPKGWYLISSVDNQVLCMNSVAAFSSLKIHRCNNSYIYVPGVFSSIIVEKCRNSTIFLGPAAKFVKFIECTNIVVSAVARMFMFCDVYKSNFNILTPCQPIICGSKNRKITLGPYNTFYPKLEEHMEMVNIGVRVNKWNKPIELGSNGIPLNKNQIPNYTLLRAEKFQNLVFPFEMEGSTTKNPVQLPRNYSKRLDNRQKKMRELQDMVHEKNFTEEQKSQLNAIVIARFQNWLKEKNSYKQLKGLRSIQKSIKSGSSIPVLDTNKSVKEEVATRTSRSSTRGSGDIPNGIDNKFSNLSSEESGPSCSSFVSSTNGSLSRSHLISQPGSISVSDDDDDDDEVFTFEGDDFTQLESSVFLSDGEETEAFDCQGQGEVAELDSDDFEDSDPENTFIDMKMDDGLLWKAIK